MPFIRKVEVRSSESIARLVKDDVFLARLSKCITLSNVLRQAKPDKSGRVVNRECDVRSLPEEAAPNNGARPVQWEARQSIEIIVPSSAAFDIDRAFMYIAADCILDRRRIDASAVSGTQPSMTIREQWSGFNPHIFIAALNDYGMVSSYELFIELLSHADIPMWYSGAYYLAFTNLIDFAGKRVLISQSGLGEAIIPIGSCKPAFMAIHQGCKRFPGLLESLIGYCSKALSPFKLNCKILDEMTVQSKETGFDVIIMHLPTFAFEHYPNPESYQLLDYRKWTVDVLEPLLNAAVSKLNPGGHLIMTAKNSEVTLSDGEPVPVIPECLRLCKTRKIGVMEETCQGHAKGLTHTHRYPSGASREQLKCDVAVDAEAYLRSRIHRLNHIATVLCKEGSIQNIKQIDKMLENKPTFNTTIWKKQIEEGSQTSSQTSPQTSPQLVHASPPAPLIVPMPTRPAASPARVSAPISTHPLSIAQPITVQSSPPKQIAQPSQPSQPSQPGLNFKRSFRRVAGSRGGKS